VAQAFASLLALDALILYREKAACGPGIALEVGISMLCGD